MADLDELVQRLLKEVRDSETPITNPRDRLLAFATADVLNSGVVSYITGVLATLKHLGQRMKYEKLYEICGLSMIPNSDDIMVMILDAECHDVIDELPDSITSRLRKNCVRPFAECNNCEYKDTCDIWV